VAFCQIHIYILLERYAVKVRTNTTHENIMSAKMIIDIRWQIQRHTF